MRPLSEMRLFCLCVRIHVPGGLGCAFILDLLCVTTHINIHTRAGRGGGGGGGRRRERVLVRNRLSFLPVCVCLCACVCCFSAKPDLTDRVTSLPIQTSTHTHKTPNRRSWLSSPMDGLAAGERVMV